MPTPRTASSAASLASLALALAGCGPGPLFPDDYAKTYVNAYDCRFSTEHPLKYVRILVAPAAAEAYRSSSGSFAAGTVVVKEEYVDAGCTELDGFTVMRKEPAGTAIEGLGWSWQSLDAERRERPGGVASCIACHRSCEFSFDATCLARTQ